MRIVWRARAKRRLREITGYIAERDPDAATRLEQGIFQAVEQLAVMPFIHRPGRVPGTREAVVHPNYIIVYFVGGDFVRILTVLHARQQYP